MSDVKIIPSPVDPKRFFIMKGTQAVAQGDYRGRSEDQIMQDFTAKVGAPKPQGNVNSNWLQKVFSSPEMQEKLVSGSKNANQAVTIAKGLQDIDSKGGGKSQLREKYDASDAVKNILAMRLLKQRLESINQLKSTTDSVGRVSQVFDSPTDTGPVAGRVWRATSNFSGTGDEKPIGYISALIGNRNPEAQAQRAALESSLKELQEIGFFKGGKQLTGREMATVIGPLPSMYDDEPTFYKKIDRSLKETIPNTIKQQVQILLDLGYSDDAVADLLKNSK